LVLKNGDEHGFDPEIAKEFAETKIVIAQTFMDLHEKNGLAAPASFVLQRQKLSELYNLGDFGYLVGQCSSIPLEHMDENGRMNYHLAKEDGQSKRNLDDKIPLMLMMKKIILALDCTMLRSNFWHKNQQMKTMELKRKNLYSENFVESLRAAIESFESTVKAETEARRMCNQLIGGILSIEVTSFFRNILFLYQMMIQHVVARFRLGLKRHNNNFAVPRSIIFAMIYLTDQVRTLIYAQGDPRNSDSFSLSKVSMAMGIHLTSFKKGHCFSLHGSVLHPGNNNLEVAGGKDLMVVVWANTSLQSDF
jgi:hypothetical protein